MAVVSHRMAASCCWRWTSDSTASRIDWRAAFSDRGDPTPISSRPSYSSRVGWNSVSHGQLDHRLREVIELSASRQLLPIAAVASKARRISPLRRDLAKEDLANEDLDHHALEAGARDAVASIRPDRRRQSLA